MSDDQAARAVAEILGYETIGTIGVVRELYRGGVHSYEDAVALLAAIPVKSTLHVRASFLARIIASLR